MKNIAVVGLGRWGKNLLREYSKISRVKICCTETRKNNTAWLKQNYPKVKHVTNPEEIINDNTIDAVVIATPIRTHYPLTLKFLESGKHVFLEKPLAMNFTEGRELVKLARKKKKILFVGHIFLYHPILKKIKSFTKNDPIEFARFDWNKLGSFQEDIILDLLSHDISIIMEIIGDPVKLSFIDKRAIITESDLLTIQIKTKNHKFCIINLNRVSIYKKRTLIFKTRNDLFVWDDLILYKLDKKSRVFKIIFKTNQTPLEIECREFIENLNNNTITFSNAEKSLKVLQVLNTIKSDDKS